MFKISDFRDNFFALFCIFIIINLNPSQILESKKTWREKAVSRRLELKHQKKRKAELKASRDHWKGKFMEQRKRSDQLEKELADIKKNAIN